MFPVSLRAMAAANQEREAGEHRRLEAKKVEENAYRLVQQPRQHQLPH
jgi:hypothetical protein